MFKKFTILYIIAFPFIIYLFCNICIKHCAPHYDPDYRGIRIQTYKWGEGDYFINQNMNPTNMSKDYFKSNNIIYIRNVSGKTPEKILAKHISSMIETEFLETANYLVNSYDIKGDLISTNQYYDGIEVYDLHIDELDVVIEVNRNNFASFFLSPYYLTIFDYKIFSNLFVDFAIIFMISFGISKLFFRIFIKSKKNVKFRALKEFLLISLSIIMAVSLFVGFSWLIINYLL